MKQYDDLVKISDTDAAMAICVWMKAKCVSFIAMDEQGNLQFGSNGECLLQETPYQSN